VSLVARIESDLREAMLARDNDRRDALRLILAALRSSEKDIQRELSEEEELQVLQRERKKRIEAAEAFRNAGREAQIEEIVDDAIAENGATSLRDMGRVMADVMPQIAGRADGSAVSQIVKEKLA